MNSSNYVEGFKVKIVEESLRFRKPNHLGHVVSFCEAVDQHEKQYLGAKVDLSGSERREIVEIASAARERARCEGIKVYLPARTVSKSRQRQTVDTDTQSGPA